MRVGLFTDGLADRPLVEALDWLAAELPELRDVEIGTGGYSPAPHRDEIDLALERGYRIAALNASGNPLAEPAHDDALRETIGLAARLGVERVVCMSGGEPRLAGGGWFPGLEEDTERFLADRVLPYWRELSAFARAEDEGLRLCLEPEPGCAVYNVSTFERVAEVGENVALNLDPSHFFWQGIDPLAVVRRLGPRIGFAHGKDTWVDPERLELDGWLQREPVWEYAAVGRGRDAAWWGAFVEALRAAGYDGVISIEVEDPRLPAEEAILRSAKVLDEALAGVAA